MKSEHQFNQFKSLINKLPQSNRINWLVVILTMLDDSNR